MSCPKACLLSSTKSADLVKTFNYDFCFLCPAVLSTVTFQCHRHHTEVRGIPRLTPLYAATGAKTLSVPAVISCEDTVGRRSLKDVMSSYKTRTVQISLSKLSNISSS